MESAGYSCPILIKLEFSRQFSEKNSHTSNLIEILPTGIELFRADVRTGLTKLIIAFRNFAKSREKERKNSKNKKYVGADTKLILCRRH